MKAEYPVKYPLGSLQEIENKLRLDNKIILQNFLAYCAETAGAAKVEKIKRVILQLYDITETDLNKQNKQTISYFLVLLNQSNKAGWTKHEAKVYVKKFLKWYYKDLDLIANIKSTKKDKQTHISENDLLTQEEFDKLLKTANTPFKRVALSLIYECGCRPQEVLNLRWKDVKFEDNFVNLSFYSNKTGETRTFPAMKTKEILWNWKQNYPYENPRSNDLVFPSPRSRDKPLDSATLNKMFRALAKEAGINKDIWNYLLRHTRLTKLYEELPQQIVEKLAGHKNQAHIYAHISQKKARDELLNKIYHIEEMPQEKRHELERKIDVQNKIIHLQLEKDMGKISKEKYIQKITELYNELEGKKVFEVVKIPTKN